MAATATTQAFYVSCEHHAGRYWQWADVHGSPQTIAILHRYARQQIALACPAVGDVLAWEPIRPDAPYDSINWTLRRGHNDLDPGEVAIAVCVG